MILFHKYTYKTHHPNIPHHPTRSSSIQVIPECLGNRKSMIVLHWHHPTHVMKRQEVTINRGPIVKMGLLVKGALLLVIVFLDLVAETSIMDKLQERMCMQCLVKSLFRMMMTSSLKQTTLILTLPALSHILFHLPNVVTMAKRIYPRS